MELNNYWRFTEDKIYTKKKCKNVANLRPTSPLVLMAEVDSDVRMAITVPMSTMTKNSPENEWNKVRLLSFHD